MSKDSVTRGELSKESPEDEIITRAQDGDVEAYGLLVERYQFRILNLVRRLISRNEIIEDIAQEIFIRAFRRIKSFRREASFYTWLYKIALNTCRNHYRRQKMMEVDIEAIERNKVTDEAYLPNTPEEVIFRRQRAGLVREALEKIPPDQREVLVMRDLEGFSYQEIADILEVPIGTVRSRIFRGRFSLKGLLSDRIEEIF